MHRTLCSCAIVAAALLGTGAVAIAQDELFPLADIERGQRGWGLSVFQGTEPERFEFEVIGVWRNLQPDTSYILAEFSGQGLDTTGVIAGMSGSPVYIDDKLVGAVSFAWPFSKEPVGGITPIESMRELLEVESPPGASAGIGLEPIDVEALVTGGVDESQLVDALSRLWPEPVGGARPGLQWLASGFGPESRRLLSAGLGELATAGSGLSESPPGELTPGSSVSGVLVDGDLRLAATGTVTDRIDDRVLAFGHSFLGLGRLSLPMATSEVLTVLSSQVSSFKVVNLGQIVGAFDFDHSAGFRGEIGGVAPMVPVSIGLDGAAGRTVNVRIAELPELTSTLLAISVLGSLEVDPAAAGSRSMEMSARFDLGEDGILEMSQSFDGPTAALEMALYLSAITGFLEQNRLGEVDIAAVDVDVSWEAEPQLTAVQAAHVSRTRVRPGESVELSVDLVGYRGDLFRRTLTLELPTDLPEGRLSLLVGDGVSIDAARLAVERSQPANLRQALELLDSLHSRNELLAVGLFSGQGLSIAGSVMPRLPDSVRSLWSAAPSTAAVPLNLVLSEEVRVELDQPLRGAVRVDLQVEPQRPVSGGGETNGNNNGRSE